MAVDLGDLIESLQREVQAPGQVVFADATDDDWVGNLQDGFWEAVLDGLITGYDESDGVITPTDAGDDDLSRDMQQLVVFYAGFRIVRNHLRNLNTTFRAKAGEVEFETQKAQGAMRDLLKELQYKRNYILSVLSEAGELPTYYIDAVMARDESMYYGETAYVGPGEGRI